MALIYHDKTCLVEVIFDKFTVSSHHFNENVYTLSGENSQLGLSG